MSVARSGEAFDLDRIAAAVRPPVANVIAFATIDSTHACALRLMAQADEEETDLGPTVILAGRQFHGAGRGGRRWVSPPGGLYLSWVRSGLDGDRIARLPMLAAAAAHAAVTEAGVAGVVVKWPNDLLVEGRKLAGILVQARHGERTFATVGLGVNLRIAPELDDLPIHRPVAVADLLNDVDHQSIAEALAARFVIGLERGVERPEPSMAAWREALVHRPGDLMTVRTSAGDALHGRFVGLTDEGFLRLDTADGEVVATGGDVVE